MHLLQTFGTNPASNSSSSVTSLNDSSELSLQEVKLLSILEEDLQHHEMSSNINFTNRI